MVDSNVLIDVIENDPHWAEWSVAQLEAAMLDGGLVINPHHLRRTRRRLRRCRNARSRDRPFRLIREPLPWEAAFMASQAYKRYRKRGGAKRSPMPDFYIGAHASLGGYRLLTRDPLRYREYFARLEVIAPDAP